MDYRNHQWIPMQNYGNFFNAPQHISYKPVVTPNEHDVPPTPSVPKKKKRRCCMLGLRANLQLFCGVALAVLIVNVCWLVYAQAKYGISDRYGTIRKGNCASVKTLDTWLHLFINILSTLLLTGSNAFMAAYSSPTREEIDRSHAQRKWLHIGLLSIRNFRGIAKRKSLVVLLLGISSIPFHLLYNSLVFAATSTNSYAWAITTEDFLTGASFNLSARSLPSVPDLNEGFHAELSTRSQSNTVKRSTDEEDFLSIQAAAPGWERLDQKACIQAYSNIFNPNRRNVVLVTNTTTSDASSVLEHGYSLFLYPYDGYFWICSKTGSDGPSDVCSPRNYLSNAASWQVFGHPIEYCLSEVVEGHCSLKFSLDIMLVMISFNALKFLMMAFVLLRFDAKRLLATVGDAAVSFLQRPDPTTWGMCLANRRNIYDFWLMPGVSTLYSGRHRRHWGEALAKKRWIMFFLLVIAALVIVGGFGAWGFSHTKNLGVSLDAASLWDLGFGTAKPQTMAFVESYGNAITMALLANTPQVVLAGIYMAYMSIMTSMFITADWGRFATTPQTLIVSSPSGKQRGTWLLGAPLGYGIGLLILQILLHWLVSQSFFVVQVQGYDQYGNIQTDLQGSLEPKFSNCGYSPLAIILSVVLCLVMCLIAIVFMFRRFPAGSPPVVSTCSAAISASCHVPPSLNSESLVKGNLRWGVSYMAMNGIGHCSLAPAEKWMPGWVGPPVDGCAYAGVVDLCGDDGGDDDGKAIGKRTRSD